MKLSKTNKNIVIAISGLVMMLVIGFFSYQYGAQTSLQQTSNDKPQSEEDAYFPEVISEKEVSDLGRRIARLQSRLEEMSKKSSELESNIAETEQVDANIEAMNARVAALPEQIEPEVSLPADSPSAKVLARPKSPSGIPVSVLQDYEKETGVSAEEIEELMRRQE